MKETHEEFMKRIIEESREPTLPERTHDALNVGGESQWKKRLIIIEHWHIQLFI